METLFLGAVAGFTIYLGLPVGRLQGQQFGAKTLLNGFSAGVLLFLLVEVLAHAGDEVEHAVQGASAGDGSWLGVATLGLIYVGGFGLGMLAVLYTARLGRRGREPLSVGPGAMAVTEFPPAQQQALRLGMAIAAAIGLHNFSEGLAIG
jgi:ZIP family zinc transporter